MISKKYFYKVYRLGIKTLSNYFIQITKNFNYLLIIQIIPLLIISSMLIKEMDPDLYKKQMTYYFISFIVFIVAAYIPWKYILWLFAPFMYIMNILLLIAVEVAGKTIGGAKRWLVLPGGFTIQPSEFMKLSILLFLAFLISKYPPDKDKGYGFLQFSLYSLIILLPSYLILREPDLGTTLLLVIASFGVLYLVGINWKIVAIIVTALAVVAPLGYKYALKPYQKKRIENFLGEPSYQVQQALIAIGSGGIEGKPKEEATQTQLKFLPVATTDFIFAYLGERYGFKGMVIVVGLYILLIIHLLIISKIYSDDYHIVVIATGLAFLFFVYMGVNIYMVIGLAPVVGAPLPMFSHGGTSFIIFAFLLGILENLISFKGYKHYNSDTKLEMIEKEH
ncbi:MAG: rod shape-determining protein RodA [Epsilonproteobacteria bacterium]|nr:rod shape-determining protein RodA [Campylobacterota bacterium]